MSKAKKKIVCFIDSFTSGGAQKQMVMLVNGLHFLGIGEVQTLQYHDIDFFEKEIDSAVKRNKIVNKNKLKSVFEIIRFFAKEEPDVIISFLHGPNNYAALYKLLFFWRKINLIVGERNLDIKPLGIKGLFLRISHVFANSIVCNSDAQRKLLSKYYTNSKLKFIPNGTKFNHNYFFSIKKNKIERIKLIVPARFINQKNPLGLLKAIKDLPNVHVYWYGEIFKEFSIHKDCTRFINENFIKNFHFRPRTKNIYKELLKYDALILPSFYEGCPNAIIDAMYCGLPVLASGVSDNLIYLKHQKELIFDPHNIDDIINKIQTFASLGHDRHQEISDQNKKSAEYFFDDKKMINNYIKLMK
jgi:glycosyltransferase involved in cell wall biosynthesis